MNLDQKVNRKNTNCIKWDIIPDGVLPFGIADMDFNMPKEITNALVSKVENTVFGYSFGEPGLDEAIIERMKKLYDVDIQKEWIIKLEGIVPVFERAAKMSNGKVVIPVPNYNMMLDVVAKNATVVEAPIITTDHYELDLESVDTDSNLFMFCNPHNPIGKVYSKEELHMISEYCKDHHMIIVSDEAHCELTFEKEHIPMFAVDDYAFNNSITLYSPGKTFNIAGLPFAYAIIPNEELRKQFKDVSYLSHPTLLSEVAAKVAYSECDDWKKQVLSYLKGNRDYIEARLSEDFPKAKFIHMEGTYLMWVDFSEYFEYPAKEILEKAKVYFGDGVKYRGGKYVRINIATQRAYIIEMLDRIASVL